mgnify:FL=1
MLFTIRAAGSLGNMPDPGKKAYRLRCRFRVGAYPSQRELYSGKIEAAEQFVRDMRKQGWEYVGGSSRMPPQAQGFRMTGPYPVIEPVTIHVAKELPAAEQFAGMLRGNRYRDGGGTIASTVLPLEENERWEYELAAVFVHETILTEVPDPHEMEETKG